MIVGNIHKWSHRIGGREQGTLAGMDWFIRFVLGLPARQIDVQRARESIPEVFGDPRSGVEQGDDRVILVVFDSPGLGLSGQVLRARLREWLTSGEPAESIEVRAGGAGNSCPLRHPNCPAHRPAGSESQAAETPNDVEQAPDAEQPQLFELKLGGGDAGGAKAFLDFVRNAEWKPDPDKIKEVILTDPYLHTSEGEEGGGSGFDNLVAFLEALGLRADSVFRLSMSPSMKTTQQPTLVDGRRVKDTRAKARKVTGQDRVGKESQLMRRLRNKFPSATVDYYQSTHRFHDRLFIVRDRRDRLGGCFGPSLNGLGGPSYYLLGNLDQRVTTKLERVFT